jgi:hypothetical protein
MAEPLYINFAMEKGVYSSVGFHFKKCIAKCIPEA